jgi:hypothetical protein
MDDIDASSFSSPGESNCSHRQITTSGVLNQDTMRAARGPTEET